jgi:hypothetical protein
MIPKGREKQSPARALGTASFLAVTDELFLRGVFDEAPQRKGWRDSTKAEREVNPAEHVFGIFSYKEL